MLRKVLMICIAFFLSACDKQNDQILTATAINVDIVTLKSQPITLTTTLPGRIVSTNTAEVRPQVSGIIKEKLFTEGSEVKEGDILYQIDPDAYQAEYNKAYATMVNARLLESRYKQLMTTQSISRQNYDDAYTALKEAEAGLKSAEVNLNYTKITAPISGHIGRSLYTKGALVQNGQSSYLTVIQQLDPIYVDVTQSSLDLLKIRQAIASGQLTPIDKNHMAVELRLEDGSVYKQGGSLAIYEVTVEETTGSLTMRAAFPNPNRELLPGMFVHMIVPQGVNTKGILVPQQAISHNIKGVPYVYIVNENSLVEQRIIELGPMQGSQWLVNSGLNDGEQVIVNGLQSIREGSKVHTSEYENTKSAVVHSNMSMTDSVAR